MLALTLNTTQIVRESLSLEDVVIGGDAAGALLRVEAGGSLNIRGGNIARTGGYGSLIHVQGGNLALEDVTLSGAQEHYLLPEPRPPVAGERLCGAVLVTANGQATLRRVHTSGNAPGLRISIGEAAATECTFDETATAAIDVQAESKATLSNCRLQGSLYTWGSRITLKRCSLAGATVHGPAHVKFRDCEILGSLCPEAGTLEVRGGQGRSVGTVVFAKGTATVHLCDFAICESGERGVELQGAATVSIEGGRITGTAGDGVAAFDAATLRIEGTVIEDVGGVPIRLAGASDGPEGAEASEFAHPGGPGGDAVALLRQRLDAISPEARPLLIERLVERADPTLRRWSDSCTIMGSAALDLWMQGPVTQVQGAIIGLAATGADLWILTAKQVHQLKNDALQSWKLPAAGHLLAADPLGAIVATDRGLFNPLAGAFWSAHWASDVDALRLDRDTVHVEGGDSGGHPTDRVSWRVQVDRATGLASPLEVCGQRVVQLGETIPKAVGTPSGEARIWGTNLHWHGRSFQLPGGINTLAADGEALLVGTREGEVYRLT